MKKEVLYCFLLFAFTPAVLSSQQGIELGKIVVTATKTPHKLEDVPVETVLITSAEIERSNAKDVSEVLRDVPGFYVQGENVPGSSAWCSRLRGLDFDRGYGLILVNGERTLGGGMGEYGSSLNQIPVDMIDRIEVVKGPGSVLYGSDAVSGVVNIITKPIPSKPKFTLNGGYGSYDTSLANLSYGRRLGDFGFLMSAGREKSRRGRYGASKDDFTGDYLLAAFDYKLSRKSSLNLALSGADLEWRYAFEKKQRVSSSFETTLPDESALKVKGYWNKIEHDFFSPGFTRRFGEISYIQGETHYTKSFGESHLATFGIEYLQKDIKANYADKKTDTASVYTQDEVTAGPFVVVFGCRVDSHSDYGAEFNPKASLMWDVAETTRLRLSAGRAFKSPTIRQLYVFFKHGAWWNKPNPGLKPEISYGYSASVERLFVKNVSADLSVFRNDIKDIIVAVGTSEKINNDPVRTWKNVQTAYTQGVEMGLKLPAAEWLSLSLGYAYLDTQNLDTKKDLPYNPKHTANVGVNYESRLLKTSFHWRTNYVSESYKDEANTQKTGDYFVSGIRVIKKITENLKLSIDADNIFESNYGEPDKQWLGRTVFGKLTMDF